MDPYNKKKNDLLGMSHGKATHQLRKAIMFKLAKMCGLLKCHQCGLDIESVDDLSIEHKTPWQSADNPKEVFFDLDNISFSHLGCNISRSYKPHKRISREGHMWCWKCKTEKINSDFSPSSIKRMPSKRTCTKCASALRKELREKTGKH